jgi:hypothetical protein
MIRPSDSLMFEWEGKLTKDNRIKSPGSIPGFFGSLSHLVVPRAFSWAADGYERLVAPQAMLPHQFRHRRGALCDRLGVLRGRVGPRRSPHRCGRDGQMRLGWR